VIFLFSKHSFSTTLPASNRSVCNFCTHKSK
jgi:hypothetical protein